MALLEQAPRSATCTALERTDCLVLGSGNFESLLREVPTAAAGVLERMLGIAAGRLVKTGSFVSQMVQWGDTARRRAITDAATGLFNRRYWRTPSAPSWPARSGTAYLSYACSTWTVSVR
jgi:CRP-like cAMP-binding protein